MSQLAFDEQTGRQLEAVYGIAEAVRRRELVRAALAARPGERLLDVGCGPGFFCAELLEEVGSSGAVVGVDASPQMLALARRRCKSFDNASFQEGDATALPVKDASFDGVLCVQVLEYVRDYPSALAELRRVLVPGGRAVVWDTDWATLSWHSADPARMQRVLEAWDEHLMHPSLPRALAPALRSAGFAGVEVEAQTFATTGCDPGSFGASLIPLIEDFAAGRRGLTEADVSEWASEQRELDESGEFFFSYTQFCCRGTRPNDSASA